MASLRTTQFYAGTVTSTTRQDLYTVPTGHVILLKTTTMRSRISAASSFKTFLDVFGATVGLFTVSVGAAPASAEWDGWVAIGPGQIIWATVGNAAGIDVVLSGSLLYI